MSHGPAMRPSRKVDHYRACYRTLTGVNRKAQGLPLEMRRAVFVRLMAGRVALETRVHIGACPGSLEHGE
jgi:hypothetical protein